MSVTLGSIQHLWIRFGCLGDLEMVRLPVHKVAFVSTVLLSFILNCVATAQEQASAHRVAPAGVTLPMVNLFNEGLKLYNAGNYKLACDKFEQLCKETSAFPDARQMYGACLLAQGRIQEALAELLKAEELIPDNDILLINLATAYRYLGQNEQSLEKYKKFLKLYPSDSRAAALKDSVKLLEVEILRSKGVASSKGQDNYLQEAITLGAGRWNQDQMPVRVFIGSGTGLKEYRDEFNDLLKQAFLAWAEASGGKLSFQFVSNPDDAMIDCAWTDDHSKFANPAEGGQALPAISTTGDIMKSTVLLLTTNLQQNVPVSNDYMSHVCLHEIGHIIGIVGHSGQPGDVMFSVMPASPLGVLSDRDKKTALNLYNAPDSILAEHPVVANKLGALGSDAVPINRAIRLNTEATLDFKTNNFQKAITKLEEAFKLSPTTEIIAMNLGSAYAGLASQELKSRDMVNAEKHFNIAADYFKKGKRKDLAVQTYVVLIQISQSTGKHANAGKYQELKRAIEAK